MCGGNKEEGEGCTFTNVCLCLLAVLLPPIAVLIKLGALGFYQERPHYLCSVVCFVALFTLAGFIPGVVLACFIICRVGDNYEG